MTVPAAPATGVASAPGAADSYELDAVEAAPPEAFVSRAPTKGEPPSSAPKKRSRRRKKDSIWETTEITGLRKAAPVAAIVVVIALLSLAVLPPVGLKAVGIVFAAAGLVLTLYGYFTGAYIAFTEDSLYCMLYLLIPLYTAYYVFSRWDEMRSRLALVLVGLALLSVGGKLLETGVARSGPAKAEAAWAAPPIPESGRLPMA
jgi:hypothetical protein